METIRSFIALELTGEIQDELAQIQDELKKSGADVKWVNPSGIHLTLKFLGNVNLESLKKIKQIINQLAKEHRRFELEISQLGAFPKIEYPRIIWVGIGQGKEDAAALAKALEQDLANLGFLPEKRVFSPHLTLGRVRSPRNRAQLKELLQSTSFSQKTMQAKKLILFKSTLTKQGAIYQSLYEAKLA